MIHSYAMFHSSQLPQKNALLLMYAIVMACSNYSFIQSFSPCHHYQYTSYHTHNIIRYDERKRFYSTKSDDGDSSITSSKSKFTATPITITSTTSIPISKEQSDEVMSRKVVITDKVNSATLQFNNKLNSLAKNYDTTTAQKVESLLLEAVKNYQECNEQDKNKDQMIRPNTVSFTNAITAWSRCTRKNSAKRAQALLDQMHTLYKEEGWIHVRPNKITYNSVITACARSREKGSALRAEELLRNMYKFYNEEGFGEEDLKPDSRSWNAVINAVARSRDKDCADRAKFLLDEMGRLYNEGDDDLLPDALTFGAIINAYANSFEVGACDQASQLLLHMESLYQMGFDKAKPTTFVYNACMNAFAKANDPLIAETSGDTSIPNRAEQAEQLLISMEKRYEEEKDYRVMPDCISYSTVINAYANSKTQQSGVHADAILRRMISRYLLGDTKCRPNSIAFTATIKAHSLAINATLSTIENEEEDCTDINQMLLETSARRCEDILQELCLLHHNHGNDRSMKPTDVTFDLVTKALEQIDDHDGVERVKLLREAMI